MKGTQPISSFFGKGGRAVHDPARVPSPYMSGLTLSGQLVSAVSPILEVTVNLALVYTIICDQRPHNRNNGTG